MASQLSWACLLYFQGTHYLKLCPSLLHTCNSTSWSLYIFKKSPLLALWYQVVVDRAWNCSSEDLLVLISIQTWWGILDKSSFVPINESESRYLLPCLQRIWEGVRKKERNAQGKRRVLGWNSQGFGVTSLLCAILDKSSHLFVLPFSHW